MPNPVLPVAERTLTPAEVEVLDRRRRQGQVFLVIGGQGLILGFLVTMWSGQDWTYSPGWAKPMVYWDALLFLIAIVFITAGIRMRRGVNEFFSY